MCSSYCSRKSVLVTRVKQSVFVHTIVDTCNKILPSFYTCFLYAIYIFHYDFSLMCLSLKERHQRDHSLTLKSGMKIHFLKLSIDFGTWI